MPFFRERTITLDAERLRVPQVRGYEAVREHYAEADAERETALVLPVGCGKSGLIAILPFSVRARRVLIIAPNLRLKRQLATELEPGNPAKNFLHERGLVPANIGWESVELSAAANSGELPAADVVVANIQQVAGDENRWMDALAADFFDLIIFDEAHHNVAASWGRLRAKFPAAKIINLSATPVRTDGQRMIGRVIYTYSIREAMERRYVRQLRAVRVNPRGLRYIEVQNGVEVEISLDEVRRLGETDAKFRRRILMSEESLASIVDASIIRLRQLRERTGDGRHKIIASALNETHCRQVLAAYRGRLMRTEMVHANRGDEENERVIELLERHEIDVIVQVRMLGEGFNHPYLSVAAVCNVYGGLTPFLQFVGRVMRLAPNAPDEEGIVVFHAGSNVAKLWDDLREYSEADQQYFEELLPLETQNDFDDDAEHERNPLVDSDSIGRVIEQGGVHLDELPLLEQDDEIRRAMDALAAQNIDPDVLGRLQHAKPEELQRLYVTRQNRRIAARDQLHGQVGVRVRAELGRRGLNPSATSSRPPDTNFVVGVKRANEAIAARIGKAPGTRDEWSLEEFELLIGELQAIVATAFGEAFDGW